MLCFVSSGEWGLRAGWVVCRHASLRALKVGWMASPGAPHGHRPPPSAHPLHQAPSRPTHLPCPTHSCPRPRQCQAHSPALAPTHPRPHCHTQVLARRPHPSHSPALLHTAHPPPPQTHARRYSHGGLIESAFATQAANAVLPPLWTLLHPVDSFSTGVLARAARTQVCCTQHSGRGWRWGLWRDGAGGVRRPWCGSGPCATRGRMPQQKSLSFWLQRGGGLFPWPSTHSANKQPWPANTSSTPPHRPHPTPPAVLCCGSA